MTWFKVDDALHSHRKAVRAGVPAMGLWVLAGSWCADHLSDGFIPDYMAERIDRDYEEHAGRLVEAGLWVLAEKGGDKGWQFHEWTDQQPTAETVMEKRAEAKDRMQKVRAAKKAREEAQTKAREAGSGEVRANTSRTSQEVRSTPTRPDPTSSSNEEERSPAAPDDLGSDDTTKKGTRVPGDFQVTPEMVAWASKEVPDVDGRTETAKFINYWQSKPGKDGLKLSWNKTWQNWMRSAQQRIRDRQGGRLAGGMQAESNAPKNYAPSQRCTQHPSQPAATCGSCRAEARRVKHPA